MLYEMLTARRAFAGDDVSETMAHVITKEMDWTVLPAQTPRPLVRLLQRCLERDPKTRLRDIGEARIVLSDSTEADTGPAAVAADTVRNVATRTVAVAAGAALVTALLTVALMSTGSGPVGSTAGAAKRFVIPLTGHALPPSGPGPFVAVSADGRTIVYVGMRDDQIQLFRRRLDELNAFPIPGSENARRPFLSPDGQSVGFITGGNYEVLRRVSLSGGTPSTILELPDQIQGAAWGPDDRIVYGAGTALFSVSATGGEPVRLTEGPVEEEILSYRWPHLVPDTDIVLYTRWRGSIATADVVAHSLATGEEQRLVDGSGVHYSAGGHIVFGNDTELWTAPFDPVRLALAGSPVRLADDLLTFRRGGAANLAVTADGTLVYVPTSVGISSSGTLVRVDRDGSNATPVHTDLLETPRHLQLSPDGQRVVLVTGPIEQGEIWIHPLDGRPPTPLWQEGRNGFPVWMDDGTRVVFSTARGNNQMDLVWLATDGDMMEPEVLLEGREGYYPAAWVPQRNELIFGQDTQSGQTRWDLRRLTAEGEVHVVVQTRSDDTEGQISPNGRFIAYESTLNDRSEVWVRPYPDGAPTRVSSNGGDEPRWSFDGTELFYLESAGLDSGRMMVATVDTEGAFRFDTPVLLFENPYRFDQSFPYVVLPDGDFIMTRATRANAVTGDPGAESRLGDHLVVIVDLDDELARIAPPAQ